MLEGGGPLGVDTETTGLNPHRDRVRLIQVATPSYALVVDLDGFRRGGSRAVPWEEPGLRELRMLLQSNVPKVLQKAAFDINFLMAEGVQLQGPFFDTMIAAKIINNGNPVKNDLGSIVKRNLGFELSKDDQKSDWSGQLEGHQYLYAAKDAAVLVAVAKVLRRTLEETVVEGERSLLRVFNLEMQCLLPIALMQWHGFQFDSEAASELQVALEAEAQRRLLGLLDELDGMLRARYKDDPSKWLPRELNGSYNTRSKESGSIRLGTKVYPGFNPRAPKQMAAKLTDVGIVLPPNEKAVPSLDQNLLAFIKEKYPIIATYLSWKEQDTLISHVVKLRASVEADGRIHGHYNQMGTKTGRLSASEPNLQQIPREKEFRSLFVAEPGYVLVAADFSQIELRVAAELSEDTRMVAAYQSDSDLHTETACVIAQKTAEEITKEERTSAKICNFGLLYGAGAATLKKQAAAQYNVFYTMDEARALVQGFRDAYPELKQWQDAEGNKTTRAVLTKIGRRRILVGFDDKYTTRINTQVQGTAGDIAKLSIAALWQELQRAPEGEARLIAMVHDEIVMEVKQEAAERWAKTLSGVMERAGAAVCERVPIKADAAIGATWAEAK